MKIRDDRKEITIFLNSSEQYKGQILYKLLIDKFIEIGVTGCTILKSNSGYGTNLKVKFSDDFMSTLISKESTIVLTIIESENKTEEIIKILDTYMGDGLVTIKNVDYIRYTKSVVTKEDIKLADSTQ
ncbi:MAG: DUF190 domain-containing protein [Spirochaetota bacterium]